MSTTITLGKNLTDGSAVTIDLDRFIETRALVQANSGGGKSWTIRRLLEQTYGKVQQIVIDSEGEFHTLREKHDYLLAAAKGGDCLASVKLASKLAHRLLEHEVSAIIDISEMPPPERVAFVKEFLEALVEAPQRLWHPCMIVVDEAHKFCPEVERGHKIKGLGKKSRDIKVSSTDAVVNLMALGRKRGFCGVLATQRLAKLNKDAAAEVGNFLIGLANIDIDQARAASALGMTAKNAIELRNLEPGHFYAFGPAISREIVRVAVGPVTTTHPKAGQRTAPLPPTRAGIKRVMASFADLPAEVENEESKVAQLEAEVKRLKAQTVNMAGRSPTLDTEAVKAIQTKAYERGRAESGHRVKTARGFLARLAKDVDVATRSISGALANLGERVASYQKQNDAEVTAPTAEPRTTLVRVPGTSAPVSPRHGLKQAYESAVTGQGQGPEGQPEQKILDALAYLHAIGIEAPSTNAVALVAGYRPNGGAFKNPKSRLATKDLIDYPTPGTMRLTQEGSSYAKLPDLGTTGEDLRSVILDNLDGPERKIMEVLIEHWPDSVANEDLAAGAGYDPDGGAFKNPRGRLSTLGIMVYEKKGCPKAADLLFPGGVR